MWMKNEWPIHNLQQQMDIVACGIGCMLNDLTSQGFLCVLYHQKGMRLFCAVYPENDLLSWLD